MDLFKESTEPEITIKEMIRELKRELAMREKVYPRWIQTKKITEHDAEHRIDVLKEVLKMLEQANMFKTSLLFNNPTQPT